MGDDLLTESRHSRYAVNTLSSLCFCYKSLLKATSEIYFSGVTFWSQFSRVSKCVMFYFPLKKYRSGKREKSINI